MPANCDMTNQHRVRIRAGTERMSPVQLIEPLDLKRCQSICRLCEPLRLKCQTTATNPALRWCSHSTTCRIDQSYCMYAQQRTRNSWRPLPTVVFEISVAQRKLGITPSVCKKLGQALVTSVVVFRRTSFTCNVECRVVVSPENSSGIFPERSGKSVTYPE